MLRPLNSKCFMVQWQQVPLASSQSRASPQGGLWRTAVVPCMQAAGPSRLQFYITSAQGEEVRHILKCVGIGCREITVFEQAHHCIHNIEGFLSDTLDAPGHGCAMLTPFLHRHCRCFCGHGLGVQRFLSFKLHSTICCPQDRPAGGGFYKCMCPGGFKLMHGRLHPFPRARVAPTMLVRSHY